MRKDILQQILMRKDILQTRLKNVWGHDKEILRHKYILSAKINILLDMIKLSLGIKLSLDIKLSLGIKLSFSKQNISEKYLSSY